MSLHLRTQLSLTSFPLHSLTKPHKSSTNTFTCYSTGKKPIKINTYKNRNPLKDLSLELSQRVKTHLEERDNAMQKSKEMLFTELSKFLQVGPYEAKRVWARLDPDEKMGLANEFVDGWALNFHPLSPKSVKDMVDEYVAEAKVSFDEDITKEDISSTNYDLFFQRLRKLLLGLSQRK